MEARRLSFLTPSIFTEMNKIKAEVEAKGIDVINLGIGSPDRPPAPHLIDYMIKAVGNPNNYGYPTSEGTKELRCTVAKWYKKRFDVDLDADKEVLILMGSQDGLAHLAQALINPGDIALVPDPGYPIYSAGILLAEGELYPLPLLKENSFLPDIDNIPEHIAQKAKLIYLNYPNNPVAAVADVDFYSKVVKWARGHDIVVCHDAAYSELAFDGYSPLSFLQTPGAKEVGVEFHSFSKTYNLAGCRIGMLVGKKEVIQLLAKLKSNIDYGVFLAIQEVACRALTEDQSYVKQMADLYQERRNILIEGLSKIGWSIPSPKASMFLWAPLPNGWLSSKEFAFTLLRETGVLVIPGVSFGPNGEGYVRIALTQEGSVLEEVPNRLKAFLNR